MRVCVLPPSSLQAWPARAEPGPEGGWEGARWAPGGRGRDAWSQETGALVTGQARSGQRRPGSLQGHVGLGVWWLVVTPASPCCELHSWVTLPQHGRRGSHRHGLDRPWRCPSLVGPPARGHCPPAGFHLYLLFSCVCLFLYYFADGSPAAVAGAQGKGCVEPWKGRWGLRASGREGAGSGIRGPRQGPSCPLCSQTLRQAPQLSEPSGLARRELGGRGASDGQLEVLEVQQDTPVGSVEAAQDPASTGGFAKHLAAALLSANKCGLLLLLLLLALLLLLPCCSSVLGLFHFLHNSVAPP